MNTCHSLKLIFPSRPLNLHVRAYRDARVRKLLYVRVITDATEISRTYTNYLRIMCFMICMIYTGFECSRDML